MGMYGVIASTQMASKVRCFGGIDKVRLVAYTSRSSAAAVHEGDKSNDRSSPRPKRDGVCFCVWIAPMKFTFSFRCLVTVTVVQGA
jgi:hypothetical protein